MHPSTAAGNHPVRAVAQVLAGWALFSKHPGQTMDYAILEATFDPGVAERYIRAGLTSHADDPATGRPEALPWLSFVGTAQEPAASCVMRVDWSEHRDGTGQAVTPTRLLLIPWTKAAEVRSTFFDQARAMQFAWDRTDGGPRATGPDGVLLELHSDYAAISETAIDHVGLDWAAGVAALLLDGRQVAIALGRTPLPLGERLRRLDAVFAVLPYAYRARLSAATWASHRVKHSMRLSFAERAGAGQVEVAPDRQPPDPKSAEAVEYLRILRGLVAKGIDIRKILRHLAEKTEVGRCRDASEAVDLLAALDVAASVHRDILAGRATPARVAQVLATFGWDGLETNEMRTDYAGFLTGAAAGGDPEARVALEVHWAGPVVTAVARLACAELAAGRPAAIRVWFEIAARHRPEAPQGLLLALTREVAGCTSETAVAGWQRLLAKPPAGTHVTDPELQRLFIAHPAATAALLRRFASESGGMSGLTQLVDLWLPQLRSQPTWVNPVVAAVKGDPAFISVPMVHTLQSQWAQGVPFVLRVAVANGHLGVVIGPLFEALAAAMVQSPTQEASVLAVLRPVPAAPAALNAQARAYVDVLMLIGDGTAPFLDRQPDRPDDAYLRAMGEGMRLSSIERRRTRMLRDLYAILVGQTVSAGRMRRLVAVVEQVAQELSDGLAPLVNMYCIANPQEIPALRLGPLLTARLNGCLPRYQAFARRCRSDATGPQVAEDVMQLLPYLEPEPLLSTLEHWLVPGREEAVFWLLTTLRRHAPADERFGEFADDVLVEIFLGRFSGGRAYAQWLKFVADHAQLEFEHAKRAKRRAQRADQRQPGLFRTLIQRFTGTSE